MSQNGTFIGLWMAWLLVHLLGPSGQLMHPKGPLVSIDQVNINLLTLSNFNPKKKKKPFSSPRAQIQVQEIS